MKKGITILLMAILIGTGHLNAQTKIGYISIENIVSLIPETSKVDTLLSIYQTDSLNAEFNQLIASYNYNDSTLSKTDTSRIPKSTLKQMRAELENIAYQVQNWKQISEQAMTAKQNELFAPIYKKAYDALKTVAKEKGYTHVFNKEAFLVAPDADDLLTAVALKLNIKLTAK
jgi:outer membrane protein